MVDIQRSTMRSRAVRAAISYQSRVVASVVYLLIEYVRWADIDSRMASVSSMRPLLLSFAGRWFFMIHPPC